MSVCSAGSLTGKLVRLPFRLIPDNCVVRVLTGPIRGMKWVAGSYLRSCYAGTYEWKKANLFFRSIRPGMTVYDIGANVGYYSLIASRAAGPGGKVFSFEPLTENMALLRRHAGLNGAENIVFVESALADRQGTECFKRGSPGTGSGDGKLSLEGEEQVPVTTLDAFVAAGNPGPDCIKIDVEGAEERLLRGACRTLAQFHPLVFLAGHSPSLSERCCGMLRDAGYRPASLWKNVPPGSSAEIIATPVKVKDRVTFM